MDAAIANPRAWKSYAPIVRWPVGSRALIQAITYCISTGCALLNPSATPGDESPARYEPDEPPQVVDESLPNADQPEDGRLHGVIQKWVDRVSNAKPAPAPETAADAPATLAADQASPPSQEVTASPPAPPSLSSPPPPTAAAGASSSAVAVPARPPEQANSRLPAEPPPSALTVSDTPAVNAPAAAAGAPTTLADVLERLGPPADDSFREQLDRRMMWVIAGEYDRAREPLAVVTAEQQELATRFIEAWVAIREGQADDPAGAVQAATRELNQLQTALQKLSDLRLPAVKVCSAVYGFGQYDALEPARFNAGVPNEFVLYCEVSDFVSEQSEDGWFTSTFDLTTTLLNRAGEAVLELKDTNIVDRCRNRRRDCFIPRLVRLPAALAPGAYVAKTTVVDKLGQKVAQERTTFQLVARP